MIHRVPLSRSLTPGELTGLLLACPLRNPSWSGLLPLAARGLGALHSLPYELTGERPHHRVYDHVSYPSQAASDPLHLARLLRKGKAGRSRTRLSASSAGA